VQQTGSPQHEPPHREAELVAEATVVNVRTARRASPSRVFFMGISFEELRIE
jgi:hypothetical protein